MKRRIIIGISGSSGVIYGVRALQILRERSDIETHLIVSAAADRTLAVETGLRLEDLKPMCDVYHSNDNIAASIASGSFVTEGMAVMPCSIKTLSGIANSFAESLIVRAADVVLKERRRLVLVVRETPLHKGHLELMLRAADHGAQILPPVPAFYHAPRSVEDIVDHTVGKVFDALGIEHELYQRWGEKPPGTASRRT